MKANELKIKFIFLGLLLLVSNQVLVSTSYGFKFQSPPRSIANYELTWDYYPTDGWQVSTPNAQNMSKSRLDDMSAFIKDQGFAIDSILIVRNGYIVFEQYLNPDYNQNSLHLIYSCTKSVTSALTGIAIQNGHIDNVDQKVVDFFPERTIANLDVRKQNLKLKHLLTMSAGFEWNEWYPPYIDAQGNPDFRNSYIQMIYSDDNVQFVLDRSMAHNPGTEWVYNSGATHLLSAIIQQTTGYTMLNFAQEFLFGPLGISDVEWMLDPQGVYYGGHGLYLRPRDMAKFGYLYLNKGTWDTQQLIPKDWVALSTSSYSSFDTSTDYCYGWWRKLDLNVYYALGFDGQFIIVIPQYDLVVVFTSSEVKHWPYFELLSQYIFSSVEKGADPPLSIERLMIAVVVVGFILVLGFVIVRRKRFK